MAKEAKTSVTFYPIKAHLSALDVLLKDMEKRWLELGQGESILPELIKKKVLIKSGKIKGYIGLEKDKPVCVAWADLPHGSYGNMVVHAIKPRYQIPLVEQILSSGMVKGTVVELVQLVAGFEYRDAFCSVGFHEKERQRMIFEYDGVYQAPDISENVTFTPLSSDTVEAVGNISFAAHDIRSNIEGYYDFATPEQRSNMAKRLRDGKYGKTVDSACIMMAYDGEDAGLCDVIEMSCWGHERVAWIMDVAIHPKFQGMGLSRTMLEYALAKIYDTGIPVVGLAVTISNTPAIKLYQNLGFQDIEFFVEIVF